MICFPNAKINFGLHVLAQRRDGFHAIETIFFPIGLCDVLEAVESETLRFKVTGRKIGGGLNQNSCIRAYQLLKKDFAIPPVNVHLHKIIPIGAGLGGGSSDGAFFIRLLNELFDLRISEKKMKHYAAQLGSDCSFFIRNTASFAFERGDKLEPFEIHLEKYHLVVVFPEIHINTALAYSGVVPKKDALPLKDVISNLPVERWKNKIKNDFENVVFPRFHEVKKIKDKMYSLGAVFASMSGSGSSVFGIFDEKKPLKQYFGNHFVWEGKA